MENKTAGNILDQVVFDYCGGGFNHKFLNDNDAVCVFNRVMEAMEQYGNQQWNAALEEVKKHGRIVKSEGGIETFVLTENIDNLKK